MTLLVEEVMSQMLFNHDTEHTLRAVAVLINSDRVDGEQLGDLAALANAGTLAAFTAVSVCMLIMRRRAPDAPRSFRTPMPWVVGRGAIGGCIYLFFSLPMQTQLWFLVWNIAGLALYFLYARRNAVAD